MYFEVFLSVLPYELSNYILRFIFRGTDTANIIKQTKIEYIRMGRNSRYICINDNLCYKVGIIEVYNEYTVYTPNFSYYFLYALSLLKPEEDTTWITKSMHLRTDRSSLFSHEKVGYKYENNFDMQNGTHRYLLGYCEAACGIKRHGKNMFRLKEYIDENAERQFLYKRKHREAYVKSTKRREEVVPKRIFNMKYWTYHKRYHENKERRDQDVFSCLKSRKYLRERHKGKHYTHMRGSLPKALRA